MANTFVKPSRIVESEVLDLPPCDQFAPRMYMSFVLCFQLDSEADPPKVYWELRCGLSDALIEYPFFAGRVVTHDMARDRIQIHALGWTGLLRSWAKYTSAVTNGLKVAPCRSPNILDRSPLFQVNTDIALEDCHLLVKIDDVAKYLRSISQAWNAAPTNRGLSNIFNVHWYFSPRRLQALKAASHPKYEPSWVSTTAAPARGLQALKAASQPNSEEKPWLSTNDALCALLWRHITIARQLRQSPYKTTTFEISYNVRGLLSPSLDPKYVGNAYGDASTVYPIEELYSTAPDCQSLAARAVREAKNRVDNSMVEVVRLVVSG